MNTLYTISTIIILCVNNESEANHEISNNDSNNIGAVLPITLLILQNFSFCHVRKESVQRILTMICMLMTVELFWWKLQSDGVDHQYEWRGGSGKFLPNWKCICKSPQDSFLVYVNKLFSFTTKSTGNC